MSADRYAAAPGAATWYSRVRPAETEHIAAVEVAEEPIAEVQQPAAVVEEEAQAGTVAAEVEARAAAAHKVPQPLELLDDTPAAAMRAAAEVAAAEPAIPGAPAVAAAMPAGVEAVAEANPLPAEASPLTRLPSPAQRSTDILSSTAEHLSRIAGIPN
jgi:hypothetical protein